MNRQQHLSSVCLLAAPLLFACTATRNPGRPAVPVRTASVDSLQVTEAAGGEPELARTDTEPKADSPKRDPYIVAYVAGSPVDVRELLDLWLFRDSPGVHDMLGELVVGRFTLAEAARLGLRIPDEDLDLAYQRGLDALRREVERVSPGTSVDEFLQRRRGIDPTIYREHLREQSARALISERVVRSWLLSTEHVVARAIVCENREQLEIVEAALKDGTEFELLARDMSLDPDSAKEGGLLPPITRSDSAVARLGFVTPVGEVGGPIEEGGSFMLLQVVERPVPLEGNWRSIGLTVEDSLNQRPVHEVEWMQWEEAMFQRYEVDTTPFLELVGQPGR